MNLLTVDTVESARKKLLDCAGHWKVPVEQADLGAAAGRVLAEDIAALSDIPGFRRSTVDGYALRSADTSGAGESLPVFLTLTGPVRMGKAAGFDIRPGECAAIPTGGMIPRGADAVVMIEYCEPFGENQVAVYDNVPPGKHVAEADEDTRRGAVLLRKGRVIRPQETGILAAAGITSIPVYAPLALTLISTGDELVPPTVVPRPGEIRDINTYALGALAAQSGYRIIAEQTIADDGSLLEAALRNALVHSDVIVMSGGSSQGEKDMTAEVFSRVSNPGILTRGIALKPGKPTVLAYNRETDTVLAGLPGHPVSALTAFRFLIGWLADALTGREAPRPIPAKMACNLPSSPGRTTIQPVILRAAAGAYAAEPVFGKSGMISTLTRAEGYIVIDMNTEGLRKDETVMVYPL
jgi:molybdopterin molybdotransferase